MPLFPPQAASHSVSPVSISPESSRSSSERKTPIVASHNPSPIEPVSQYPSRPHFKQIVPFSVPQSASRGESQKPIGSAHEKVGRAMPDRAAQIIRMIGSPSWSEPIEPSMPLTQQQNRADIAKPVQTDLPRSSSPAKSLETRPRAVEQTKQIVQPALSQNISLNTGDAEALPIMRGVPPQNVEVGLISTENAFENALLKTADSSCAPLRVAPTTKPQASMSAPSQTCAWIPPGTSVRVGDSRCCYTVPFGMLYIGSVLPPVLTGPYRTDNDPALIDPSLPISHNVDVTSTSASMGYWPAYGSIAPSDRGAYLEWLSGGRSNPLANIGYVFLFFYGLERRVLVDARLDPTARGEILAIAAEVRRLLGIYGDNRSFEGYATGFLEVLDTLVALSSPESVDSIAFENYYWDRHPRSYLAVKLARSAASREPIDPKWALLWALPTGDPSLCVRRCPREFDALFGIRFQKAFPSGFVPRQKQTSLTLEYRPASASFGGATQTIDTGLIQASDHGKAKLAELCEQCASELRPFSVWRGKRPNEPVSIEGFALLPMDLTANVFQSTHSEELAKIKRTLDSALGSGDTAVIDSDDLLSCWPSAVVASPTKAEARQFAQILERFGVGIEPDVRFGGSVQRSGSTVVLFRQSLDAQSAPSADYDKAALILALVAAVVHADGKVTTEERSMLESMADSFPGLVESERVRLRARAKWLLSTAPKITGLKKRLSALPSDAIELVAGYLVDAAVVDGDVGSDEIKHVASLFKSLGISSKDVAGRLQQAAARVSGSIAPESLTRGSAGGSFPSSYPSSPPHGIPGSGGTQPSSPKRKKITFLDMEAVNEKLADSAELAAILGSIYSDDDAPGVPTVASVRSGVDADLRNALSIWKLDSRHSELVRTLCKRGSWSRSEVESICETLRLLPDGAIERINDHAFEAIDAPFSEGDDPLELSPEALAAVAELG